MDQELALELEEAIHALKVIHKEHETLGVRLSWIAQRIEGIVNRRKAAKEGSAQ